MLLNVYKKVSTVRIKLAFLLKYEFIGKVVATHTKRISSNHEKQPDIIILKRLFSTLAKNNHAENMCMDECSQLC